MVGRPILESIDEFMHKSRELIMVISQASLESGWCRYELETAHTRALQRNKHVIIIKLGDLPVNIEHTPTRNLLDTCNFLEWKMTKDGQKLFWARLITHLYGQEFGCTCCRFGLQSIGYNEVRNHAL